jgi:hypothetical protein
VSIAALHVQLAAGGGGLAWLIRWLIFRVLWRAGGLPGVIAFFVLAALVPLAVRQWRERR